MILVDVQGVSASRPGKPLFGDLSLTLSTGDRVGIVGINGCGKSTLLRILAGTGQPEDGTVRRGRGARIAALDQDPVLDAGSVRQAVGDDWQAFAVLDRLGMGPLLDADTATLSGGQAKRVALAQTLVTESDLLILDEPTNHLDIDAIAWLEEWLEAYRGGLVLVTHDRHVLDRVCTKVLELDRGTGYLHDGGYEAYLAGRDRREEQAAQDESTRKVLARKELAWLQRGAPARTRKPKARIESATGIVEGRALAAARSAPLDLADLGAADASGAAKGQPGWGAAGVANRYPGTPRLGDKVIELHGIGHRWSDTQPFLFRGVDLLLDDRERLGLVGANGTGKSTLLDIIAGRVVATTGRIETGPTVRLAYYDQRGAELDLSQRVRDAVAGPGNQAGPDEAALLEAFWFESDAQWAPIGLLSGGERRRLQLVLALATKPNVLLLDEPTNDLDLDTLRALEDHLDGWPGALVVVSHDRTFLERTVTDVLVFDESRSLGRRPGGYAQWEEDRKMSRRRGRAAVVAVPQDRPATPAPKPSVAAAVTPGRSPSTLRHLVKQAESTIATLTKRRARLEAELADAAATASHEVLNDLGTELTATITELDAAEESWLALSEELEAAVEARRESR